MKIAFAEFYVLQTAHDFKLTIIKGHNYVNILVKLRFLIGHIVSPEHFRENISKDFRVTE